MIPLRFVASVQLFVTGFLVVLLWSLHAQLRRPAFTRWRGWALRASVAFFAVGVLALLLPREWALAGSPRLLGPLEWSLLTSANLMTVDVVLMCGICLGMILLLVEGRRHPERELHASVSHLEQASAENLALQAEISKRHEAEQARRRSEAKLAAAFRSSPCCMAITTLAHSRFLDINEGFERLTGFRRDEVIGRTSLELGLWLDPRERDEMLTELKGRGRILGRELQFRGKSGAIVTLLYSAELLRIDGEPCVLSASQDVTDQHRAELRARELQDELAHAGRVMALGALTGSLAHEINQPLTAIMANARAAGHMLTAEQPDLREVRAALDDILSDNRRIGEVLRRLRRLLKKDRGEYVPVDVNAIVNEVVELVHSDLVGRQVALDVSLAPDLPSVLGDRIQLQQVMLNLLLNAGEAVRGSAVDARRVRLTTAVESGRVVLSVSDRGVGVSNEQLARMFEPFYTTKSDGMGLGLSICRTIIDAHSGTIVARRNPDRGLTCSFSLEALPSGDPRLIAAEGGTFEAHI